MNIIFEKVEGRRKKRAASTKAKIETVYETLDAAEGTAADYESGISDAFVAAAKSSILNTNGDLVDRDFVPVAVVAVKEEEVEITNPSMSIKRGNKEMNFPQASAFCRKNKMKLPQP